MKRMEDITSGIKVKDTRGRRVITERDNRGSLHQLTKYYEEDQKANKGDVVMEGEIVKVARKTVGVAGEKGNIKVMK